ncbi:MAG: GHKL domain-containing protein [Acidobacteriaceae bacterium]|nr:GHKL domain-containing protein [Acidobacteriaceae bacterium]
MPPEPDVLDSRRPGHSSFFRAQDFAWLFLIAVLIATTPETNYNFTILLVLIGMFQIVEPRLTPFSSRRGQIASIILKLLFSYLLVGYTHTIFSPYYPIFLIPMVSAATIFELRGVIVVTLIAFALYCSFLLPVFIDWKTFELPPGYATTLGARLSFYAIVAFLVYEQAKAKRDEMARTQEAADRLAESNRNLRQAQASLRRSERLAALGQLTAGLAHELRNPLGTIKGSAELLQKQTSSASPALRSEMAGYIVSEVDRMNGLISNFLDFAKPLQIRPVEAELAPVVDEAVRDQADLSNTREVKVTISMPESAISFEFDPDLLRLVLANLIQNAIQASAPGQQVEIRAAADSDLVRILVTDHGEGIQAQHLENIFNPFFTTKPQGVGLGLAIVSKIVDEHHGRVNVFSEPGAGTTFEIALPKEQPA